MPNKIQLSNQKVIVFILGLVFFCFSIAAALIFQKLLLPNMGAVLVPGTTLTTDSAYFHSIAVEMAESIKLNGWSSWSLFPNNYTSLNVSILAAFYVLFGYDTALAIPLNALFHAFGGVLVFMITVELSKDRLTGVCAGVVASLVFVLFPSALNWYGQILKDGYSIVGVLAVLLIWIKGIKIPANTYQSFVLVVLGALALSFLIAIRPYFLKLTLLFVVMMLIAMIFWRLISKNKTPWIFFLYVALTFIPIHHFLSVSGGLTTARTGETYAQWGVNKNQYASTAVDELSHLEKEFSDSAEVVMLSARLEEFVDVSTLDEQDGINVAKEKIQLAKDNGAIDGKTYERFAKYLAYQSLLIKNKRLTELLKWKWQPESWLPGAINRQLEVVATTRLGLIFFGIDNGADSLIDADRIPNRLEGVVTYFPRALQVAVLAPFPTSWLEKLSIPRLVSSVEMTIIYIGLLGIIPLLRNNRSPQIFLAFSFSFFFLLIYGVITANVGTLYRVRYPFEMILVLLGMIGWASYFNRRGMLRRWLARLRGSPEPVLAEKPKNTIANESSSKNINRKNVIGAGIMVSILTFVGFVGFFLRDVLMAYEFGFSKSLDEFYLALLIPMFIVTVFCTPLGAAFVPFLSRIFEKNPGAKVGKIISHLVAIVLGVMFLVSIALHFLSPAIFETFQMTDPNATGSGSLLPLLTLASIILIFSGVVILGNSVLMAKHRLIIPSAAQVVVPVIAIFALLLFGSAYGVVAVMAGMVVGQLINLIIIHYYLKTYGKSLLPKYNAAMNHETSDLWRQYLPLLASAFFAGVMLPIDTMLASTLANGNVSIFNLGMKIVLFISGLLGAVVSNVMLPYFSSIVEKHHAGMVKKELSFFMLIATFASVPISVMLYLWSEQIVNLIFYSKTFIESDLVAIQSVMQYSVVQIPFFICNVLLLKYATATRHLRVITISAFVGLVLNVGISLLLMPKMGVSGIALATSVAMIVSSALILLMLSFYRHISIVDTLVVLLNWMLFLTLIVALHFQSIPSAVMTIITYGILLFGYTKLINNKGDLLAV